MKEEQLQNQAELYALIQNDTRKQLLQFIYQEPRTYTDLIEHTALKPGSLYHHLKVLDYLVEKRDHGLYAISTEGRQVINSLDMVDDVKPDVNTIDTDQPVKTDSTSAPALFSLPPSERMNQVLWLGLPNWGIVLAIAVIIGLMASQGVAIAGIALYAAPLPLLFTLLAFGLGFFSLYYIERLVFDLQVHRGLQYAMVIRIMGMLPASLLAVVMYLLFLAGFIASSSIWLVFFSISSVLGYTIMVLGLQYLRGLNSSHASLLAAIPAMIDLLIGLTILLLQN